MIAYIKNLGSLIKSFHGAWKAGYHEDLVVVPMQDMEDMQKFMKTIKADKDLCWDCVDHVIAGGKACDVCAFKTDTCLADHYGETIGCDEWTPKLTGLTQDGGIGEKDGEIEAES